MYKMKFFILSILCYFVIVLSACQSDRSNQSSTGNIEYNDGSIYAPTIIYNFNKVDKTKTSTIHYSFILENISDTIVTMESIEALCSCISINEYKTNLNPDDSIIISGEIDISNQTGKINKPIFIRYNSGMAKTMLLRIKGFIK